jgi:hypothetical protein
MKKLILMSLILSWCSKIENTGDHGKENSKLK